MELDHREPSQKTRCVAEMTGSYTLSQIRREIEKCDAVCSNCHSDRTFYRRSDQNMEKWKEFQKQRRVPELSLGDP